MCIRVCFLMRINLRHADVFRLMPRAERSAVISKEAMIKALTRFDRFDHCGTEFLRRFARPFALGDVAHVVNRINVTEDDKDYEVRAEIPGVNKDHVRVSVDGNFVPSSAEVPQEKGREICRPPTGQGEPLRQRSGELLLAHEINGSPARLACVADLRSCQSARRSC